MRINAMKAKITADGQLNYSVIALSIYFSNPEYLIQVRLKGIPNSYASAMCLALNTAPVDLPPNESVPIPVEECNNPPAKKDPVNHPSHYTFGKYEVADVLDDWFGDNPLMWQVGKYAARAPHKGNELQDLEKAEWYLKRRIARVKAAFAPEEEVQHYLGEMARALIHANRGEPA